MTQNEVQSNEVQSIVEDSIRDRGNTNWDEIVQHYISLKSKLPKALLLYRVVYWYFAFDSDAKTIAQKLKLVLTQHQLIDRPHIVIPKYYLFRYVDHLLNSGYTVAIYDKPYHRIEQLKTELQS